MRPTLLALAVAAVAPALRAQDVRPVPAAPESLAPGARVRVTVQLPYDHPLSRHHVVTGRLVRLDADSVVVERANGRIALPRPGVGSVAVTAGVRSRASGLWRGARYGMLGGAIVGAALGLASYDAHCDGFFCLTREESAVAGGVLLGTVGTVGGAVVGFATAGERWRTVTVAADARVALVATPSRLGLALRL